MRYLIFDGLTAVDYQRRSECLGASLRKRGSKDLDRKCQTNPRIRNFHLDDNSAL